MTPNLRMILFWLGTALRRHSLAVLCYSLLVIAFTWPTAAYLQTAITSTVDSRECLWNIWWVSNALLSGDPIFFSSYMFYPTGISLYFHTLAPLNSLLAFPLVMMFGLTAAYNIMNMLWFVVAAVGAYALAYYITKNRAAAFIAGIIYGFSPYMAFHLWAGQVALLSAGMLPLYLLALLVGLRERWPALLLATGLLLLIGFLEWHYLIFAVLLTGLVAIYESFRVRQPKLILSVFARCAAVGGFFLVLFSPVLVRMIDEYLKEPTASRPIIHSVLHSVDLLAFWVPSIYQPLWGDWAQSIFNRLVSPTVLPDVATLGYVALALGLLGTLREWRRAGFFALIFIASLLLALGPYLQVGGMNSFDTDHPIPMPFLFFRMLPLMTVFRFPSRFLALAMLALAMLAAIGVAWLLRQPRMARMSPRMRAALIMFLAVLVLFEFWPRPFPMDQIADAPDLSPFYRQLATDPEDYAILEVPNLKQDAMFYQTVHQKRIFGGRIAREKLHDWRKYRFFGALIEDVPPRKDIGVDESPNAARAAMACQGVKYVVFYKGLDAQQGESSAAIQSALFADIAPVYEDSILRAYQLPAPSTGEAFWTPDRNWYKPEANQSDIAFRWAKGDTGTFFVYPCGASDVDLRFNAMPFAQDRTLQVSLNGSDVGSFKLTKDDLISFEIPLTLQPGKNKIVFHSLEPATSPAEVLGNTRDDRLLSIVFSSVSILPRYTTSKNTGLMSP